MSPDFLVEDEHILNYIKIVCGMSGMVLWYFFIVVAVISWGHVVMCSNKTEDLKHVAVTLEAFPLDNEHPTHDTNLFIK